MNCVVCCAVLRVRSAAESACLDALNVEVETLADVRAMAFSSRQQLACFLGGLRFDEPFLDAGDVHRRMKCLELGLQFEGGHTHDEYLEGESLSDQHFSAWPQREQIGNRNFRFRREVPSTLDSEHSSFQLG